MTADRRGPQRASVADDGSDLEFLGPLRHQPAQSGALEFEDVVTRVFPLRANLNRLTVFCDRYLNVDIPPEIAHFRPAGPWVMLMVLNYGRMGPRSSSLGWVAQHEILFNVPLIGRWNDPERGMVTEAATVAPFIFVDNDFSITTGREVYGWPKVPVTLRADLHPWLRDPRQRQRLLSVEIDSFGELYSGQRVGSRPLLEIEQEAPQSLSQPPRFDYLLGPWARLPQTLIDAASSLPELLQAWNTFGASGDLAATLLSQGAAQLSGASGAYGNTINPKQFRSSLPNRACYQSLVNARMHIRRIGAGGLMGDAELLRGDPSGGFRILLHRLPEYPILESLGIQADAITERHGRKVAVLRPLTPFWTTMDMSYEPGRRICWRSALSDAPDCGWKRWRRPTAEASVDGVEEASDRPEVVSPEAPLPPPFNGTLGPVVEGVQGPFDFYGATVRVLPLRARSARLRQLLPDLSQVTLDAALFFDPIPFDDEQTRDEDVPDSLVFLIGTSYGRMSAADNDVGWWASRDLALVVVARSRRVIVGPDGPQLQEPHFLYWAYHFADSPIAVTEGREVLGLPTARGRIDAGADPWVEEGGPQRRRRLMTLSTLGMPAIGVGQEARERTLLEVEHRDDVSDPEGDRIVGRFLERAFPTFRDGLRVPGIAVKEMRDEERPDRPCYQSVVAFERTLRGRLDLEREARVEELEIRPLAGTYEVRIHPDTAYPLVESLGLEVERWSTGPSGAPVAVCRAVAPFWIHADLRAELPIELSHRTLDSAWTLPPDDVWRARFESLTQGRSTHRAIFGRRAKTAREAAPAERFALASEVRSIDRNRGDLPASLLEDLVEEIVRVAKPETEESRILVGSDAPGGDDLARGVGDRGGTVDEEEISPNVDACAGDYRFESGDRLRIDVVEDEVFAQLPGQAAMPLFSLPGQELEPVRINRFGATLRFLPNRDGTGFDSLTLTQGSQVRTAVRFAQPPPEAESGGPPS